MKRLAIAALALLASQVAQSDSPDARADAIVRSAMRIHQIPGVVLGVVRDGHLIKTTGTVIVLTNLDDTHSSTLGIAKPVAALYVPALRAARAP